MTIYRQGDVLLHRIDELPKTATKRPRGKGPLVLAHGEATGHTHSIGSARVLMYAVADEFERIGTAFVVVPNPGAVLKHQEHAPVKIPAGTYRVTRQREYIEGELLTVAD
jgi:hypothetical protein